MLFKRLTIALLSLYLSFSLCACLETGDNKREESVGGTTAVSGDGVHIEESSVQTEESFVQEEESSAQAAGDGEGEGVLSEEEVQLLCNAANELLALDAQVIDIFANQALAPYAMGLGEASYGKKVGNDYYSLEFNCPYRDFSVIEKLIADTYTEESGTARRFLEGYPLVGNPAVRKNYLGNTQICHLYNAGFDTSLENVTITYLSTDEYGTHRFQYGNGNSYYTFEVVETEAGYRLANSLLFIAEAIIENSESVDSAVEEIGSAVELRGECLWLNVFVNSDDSLWTEEDKAGVKSMIEEAGAYIVECGRGYGVDDLFLMYGWTDVTVEGNAPSYENGVDWAMNTFKGSSYGSYDGYVDTLLENVGENPSASYENYCIMFHFNRHGRSFCVPCDVYTGDDSAYYNEFSVLYYSEIGEGAYFSCPALYMHEFLHSYGAVDIYAATLTEKGEALAEAYFNTDIMRYEPENIRNCNIGPLTAKLVGWTEYLPSQLRDFLKECV